MQRLFDLIANVKSLDMNREFERFMEQPKAKVFTLNLNRWEQLYEQGVDANGIPLGYYRPYTLKRKVDPNLSHITLRETGAFYDSFRITTGYGHATIEADTRKGNDDLEDLHGPILGLTDDSKEALQEFMLNNGLIEQIKEAILRD